MVWILRLPLTTDYTWTGSTLAWVLDKNSAIVMPLKEARKVTNVLTNIFGPTNGSAIPKKAQAGSVFRVSEVLRRDDLSRARSVSIPCIMQGA